jgi:phosphoglycolate phosphatase-like HAD superfamily hydrolase
MNVIELIETATLFEERVENSILLLDIDDTLLKAQNIYIYRKLPTDKKEVALTPEEYAKEQVPLDKRQYYDYRDFSNPEKTARSIKTGWPIIPNLKIMDDYINKGWKIGILTARRVEDVVFKSIRDWLMYRDKGELKQIGDKLVRDLDHAINDEKKKYPGETDFARKANVIKNLAKKYDRVIFIDDDLKNVKAVKALKIPNVMVKYSTEKAEEPK